MTTFSAEEAVGLVTREHNAEFGTSPRGQGGGSMRVGAIGDEGALLLVARAKAVAKEHDLTPREQDILLELVRCDSYEEIVDELGIARSTVCTHARRVFEKTGTHSRHALTLLVAFGIRPARSRADERAEARAGRAPGRGETDRAGGGQRGAGRGPGGAPRGRG